jgi:3-mercaptopyruvate sulfurtransferase SseA
VALELRKAGWKKAVALKDGWQAWQDAELPTEVKRV